MPLALPLTPTPAASTPTPSSPAPKGKNGKGKKGAASFSPSPVREIKHTETTVELCPTVTVDQMKGLLGWEEIPAGAGKAAVPVLTDYFDKPIRLHHCEHNRQFYPELAGRYCQDMLNGRWKMNGQTFTTDVYDDVHNGMHRGIALVLAKQVLDGAKAPGRGDRSAHWKTLWPDGNITIPMLIVRGIEASAEVIRTIDDGRPRGLADVGVTEGWFPSHSAAERKTLCRILEFAVRYLWKRTQRDRDAYSPYRTNSETAEYVARHPRLFQAVAHILTENKPVKIGGGDDEEEDGDERSCLPISQYVSMSTAAGMLYLMAASFSDYDDYKNGGSDGDPLPWSEQSLNLEAKIEIGQSKVQVWTRAKEFWLLLAKLKDKRFHEVRMALAAVTDPETGSAKDETIADSGDVLKTTVIARAWAAFADGRDPTEEDVALTYTKDQAGIRHLKNPDGFTLLGAPDPKTKMRLKLGIDVYGEEDGGSGSGGNGASSSSGASSSGKGGKGKAGSGKDKSPNGTPLYSASGPLAKQLEELRADNPGFLLLFNVEGKNGVVYCAWQEDAKEIGALLKTIVTRKGGDNGEGSMLYTSFPAAEFDSHLSKLLQDGKKIGVCTRDEEGKITVQRHEVNGSATAGKKRPPKPKKVSPTK